MRVTPLRRAAFAPSQPLKFTAGAARLERRQLRSTPGGRTVMNVREIAVTVALVAVIFAALAAGVYWL